MIADITRYNKPFGVRVSVQLALYRWMDIYFILQGPLPNNVSVFSVIRPCDWLLVILKFLSDEPPRQNVNIGSITPKHWPSYNQAVQGKSYLADECGKKCPIITYVIQGPTSHSLGIWDAAPLLSLHPTLSYKSSWVCLNWFVYMVPLWLSASFKLHSSIVSQV